MRLRRSSSSYGDLVGVSALGDERVDQRDEQMPSEECHGVTRYPVFVP